MSIRVSKRLISVQPAKKSVVFKGIHGYLRSYSAATFANSSKYLTVIFAGKCVTRLTYHQDMFDELVIKNEQEFMPIQNGAVLTIHHTEL